MFLRCLFASAIVLLLGGCTGWLAETRLIPVAERDPVGLAGTYVSEEGDEFLISPTEAGFVRFADPTGKEPSANLAFDMLRERPAQQKEAARSPAPPSFSRPRVSWALPYTINWRGARSFRRRGW